MSFGAEPWADVSAAAADAAANASCSIDEKYATALSVAMIWPEVSPSGEAPSPMTLSRYDTQPTLGDPQGRANGLWFHPGIGMWATRLGGVGYRLHGHGGDGHPVRRQPHGSVRGQQVLRQHQQRRNGTGRTCGGVDRLERLSRRGVRHHLLAHLQQRRHPSSTASTATAAARSVPAPTAVPSTSACSSTLRTLRAPTGGPLPAEDAPPLRRRSMCSRSATETPPSRFATGSPATPVRPPTSSSAATSAPTPEAGWYGKPAADSVTCPRDPVAVKGRPDTAVRLRRYRGGPPSTKP